MTGFKKTNNENDQIHDRAFFTVRAKTLECSGWSLHENPKAGLFSNWIAIKLTINFLTLSGWHGLGLQLLIKIFTSCSTTLGSKQKWEFETDLDFLKSHFRSISGFSYSSRLSARFWGGVGKEDRFTYIGQCSKHCLVSSYNGWSISELNWGREDRNEWNRFENSDKFQQLVDSVGSSDVPLLGLLIIILCVDNQMISGSSNDI